MTKAQIRARLKEALAATEGAVSGRAYNAVRTVGPRELLAAIRKGEAIVITRRVAETIVEHLSPRR